jgi:hypothetical protein
MVRLPGPRRPAVAPQGNNDSLALRPARKRIERVDRTGFPRLLSNELDYEFG